MKLQKSNKMEECNMKKLIAMLLALMMVLSLGACGDKPAETTAPADGGGETKPVEELS